MLTMAAAMAVVTIEPEKRSRMTISLMPSRRYYSPITVRLGR
jgi:hypothetical protein